MGLGLRRGWWLRLALVGTLSRDPNPLLTVKGDGVVVMVLLLLGVVVMVSLVDLVT